MIAGAREALHRLLEQDADVSAALQALTLGSRGQAVVPKVIKGNRRFEQIGQENFPCWISEKGDARGADASNGGGDPAGLIVNSTQQDWLTDIEISLVWHQQDFSRAVDQRDGITAALVQLLLRNPSLDDTCQLAFVANEINDRAFRAPTHWIAFVVRVHHTIYRDA
ncbi:hypothetical protein ACI6Q5_05450 [Xanthomonas codiaei]|uniref:DUF3168 domain-containing protein n=1 Tax=Xanthomonas codiaei TaxID=56463 RepID=A0A2S7CGU1_9XANT|nr:hypothetical protein [Xanthomonas codiaei]PPU60788.1 hypothetical protein XcodCFBP4690_17050 [Xanthomonas codiaei]